MKTLSISIMAIGLFVLSALLSTSVVVAGGPTGAEVEILNKSGSKETFYCWNRKVYPFVKTSFS